MKIERFDRAYIKDYKETAEGYLTFNDVPITKSGVFPYRRQDGAISYEAKLPDEILSDHTVATAQHKSVTDEHPTELVTADNHGQLAKGFSHADARVENDKVLVSFTVTDSALIQKIKNGKREISIGFLSDIVQESGELNGSRYDSVQRNIEINHIAIVNKGRAGSDIGLRADSSAWQIEEGGQTMPTYIIDAKEYEVDPVVKAHLETQVAKLDAAEMKLKEVDALQGRVDAHEATITAKDAEITALKEKEMSADELDKEVAERVELLNTAQAFLGDSFDFTGKSKREVKEAVIVSLNKEFKGDSKSDDYVNAFYDAATAQKMAEGFKSTGDNSAFTRTDAKDDQEKELEALKAQRLNLRNAKKEEK